MTTLSLRERFLAQGVESEGICFHIAHTIGRHHSGIQMPILCKLFCYSTALIVLGIIYKYCKKSSHFSGVKFLKTCSFPSLERVVAAALAAAKIKKLGKHKKVQVIFQG